MMTNAHNALPVKMQPRWKRRGQREAAAQIRTGAKPFGQRIDILVERLAIAGGLSPAAARRAIAGTIYRKAPCPGKSRCRHQSGDQKICIDVLISSLPLNSIQVLGIGNLVKGEPIQMAVKDAKDLDRMSLRELQELEVKVQKARATAQDRNRADLRKKIEALVADSGFKMSDIFSGRGGKGRTVAAKYVNPEDPSETWTGRGRKPRWLTAKIQEGAKIEKFLIK
jgi:DNA-binding protein H-NS